MPGIILGGPNARFTRRHGDIGVSYQYINGERAMCLWPIHRPGSPAVIICDSAAYKYADDRYLIERSMEYADMWGDHASRYRAFQIAKIISEGLGELVMLPPEPEARDYSGQSAAPSGDSIEIKVGGETIATADLPSAGSMLVDVDGYALH